MLFSEVPIFVSVHKLFMNQQMLHFTLPAPSCSRVISFNTAPYAIFICSVTVACQYLHVNILLYGNKYGLNNIICVSTSRHSELHWHNIISMTSVYLYYITPEQSMDVRRQSVRSSQVVCLHSSNHILCHNGTRDIGWAQHITQSDKVVKR